METLAEETPGQRNFELDQKMLKPALKRQSIPRREDKKESRRFSVLSYFSKANRVGDKSNLNKDRRNSQKRRMPVFQTSFLERKDPYTVIRVFFLVRKFIENIKVLIQHKFFKNLSKHQINMINDLSYFDTSVSERKRFSTYPLQRQSMFVMLFSANNESHFPQLERLKEHFASFISAMTNMMKVLFLKWDARFPVLLPHSKFLIFWNSCKIFVVSICFILIPIPISFDIHLSDLIPNDYNLYFLKIFISLLICLDILIKFNSAYFNRSSLVKKRQEIAKTYIRSELILDIGTIAVIFIYLSESSLYFWPFLLLFYLKIFELKRILSGLEENINFSAQTEGIIQIMKLLFKILFIAHICGCMWHFGAIQLQGRKLTWLTTVKNLENSNWIVRYIYSFYWATTTIVTVGYGDIIPQNEYEVLISILVILIGCGVFAYSLNSLGTIITDMNRDQHEFA